MKEVCPGLLSYLQKVLQILQNVVFFEKKLGEQNHVSFARCVSSKKEKKIKPIVVT